MSVSVDWYQIELEGGVSDIDTGYLLRNEADCRLGQTRDGSPVDINSSGCQYFLSLVERTGIDSIHDDEIDQYRSVPFNQAKVETSETGRASCRDRVCQYGNSAMVDG